MNTDDEIQEISQMPQQQQFQPNILNMTMGQLLNTNPAAQNIIMRSMNLNPAQFQQLLNSAGNNQMMNQTIGELFKNGTMAQAMQTNPQQLQQMLSNPNGQIIPMQMVMTPLDNADTQKLQNQNVVPLQSSNLPKPSFFQKLKKLFT